MDEMVKSLYEAAVEGTVTSLLDLLRKDPLILDRCTVVTPYQETSLHIAAMLGHLNFCSELVSRNPRLTGEVDARSSSALHLASLKGHAEIVEVLVSARPEMCLLNDGDGMNPIHIAAMKGRVDVLKELVKVHPDAIGARVRTCQGGTALHLCVQYHQKEALKFLVEVQNNGDLVNAKDDNGNSILHLAVDDKQVEIVEYLVSETPIDVDALNSNRLSVSNILALQIKRDSKYMEIFHLLQLYSGQRSQQMPFISHNAIHLSSSSVLGGNLGRISPKSEDQSVWFEKQRNSLMVVASLIATMAFQAGINPPASFLKGDLAGCTTGKSALVSTKFWPFKVFWISNTIGFLSSLSIMLLLMSGLPLRRKGIIWIWMLIMWISIAATASTYAVTLAVTLNSVYTWLYFVAFLFLLHTFRFLSDHLQDWPFKRRLCMWMFMILLWITASLMQFPHVPPINPNDDTSVLSRIASGWIVLTSILIVLYAVHLVSFIIKVLKSWSKGLESHLGSIDHSRNIVV